MKKNGSIINTKLVFELAKKVSMVLVYKKGEKHRNEVISM